jgi:nitrite reductase/ring-hydroxylating ferredoxin subunit
MLRALCEAAAVRPDLPLQAELDGRFYAVFRVGGRYYVTENACTHGPGLLAEGIVDGEEIECPFHGGRFHIPSGCPTTPPCTVPLRVWTAHLVNGTICIDPDECSRSADG